METASVYFSAGRPVKQRRRHLHSCLTQVEVLVPPPLQRWIFSVPYCSAVLALI